MKIHAHLYCLLGIISVNKRNIFLFAEKIHCGRTEFQKQRFKIKLFHYFAYILMNIDVQI